MIWEVEQGRGVGSLARGQFERQVDTMGAGNGVSRLLGMLSWITNFLGCMLLEGGKCFAVKMHFGQRKELKKRKYEHKYTFSDLHLDCNTICVGVYRLSIGPRVCSVFIDVGQVNVK